MDLREGLPVWFGSGDTFHKLLKDRMVGFYRESGGVGRLVDVLKAIIDGCPGVRLQVGVLTRFNSGRWKQKVVVLVATTRR